MRAGLGNQMFQYAMGRRLAIENDTDLKLDATWYRRSHHYDVPSRAFNLTHFDIAADIATPADLRRIFNVGGVPVPRLLVHSLNRLSEKENPLPRELLPRVSARLLNYYWEIRNEYPPPDNPNWPYGRRYTPEMFDLRGDIYLAGFWESRKYFEEIADLIRADLTVVDSAAGKNAAVAEQIAATSSVGVHVRRGDQGGVLPTEYYEAAARTIGESIDDPTYFVFSNDPAWVKANLHFEPETTYVDHNDGSTDYEDLRLLRRCDHQIVANSTFSWWAAWLNENPEKLVYYPRGRVTWGPEDDFVPPDWVPIDASSAKADSNG